MAFEYRLTIGIEAYAIRDN